MKYPISLTLITYFGCIFGLTDIASANAAADSINNTFKITEAAPIQNTSVKEFDRTIVAAAKSYAALVQEAEGLARQLIQQALQAPSVETVVVRVGGDRFGAVAPLLTLRVTRTEWQAQPKVQAWARYGGRSSMQLLGYLEPKLPSGEIATAPAVAPPAAPTSELTPAPVTVPAAARSRSTVAPGRESPIPGQVPEASDPGYR
jgi:hypothetical protein